MQWEAVVARADNRQHSLTSRHPRMLNSYAGLMSSMKMFISRNLSLNPTSAHRPVGCSATLYASSVNSRYSSNVLHRATVSHQQRTCNKRSNRQGCRMWGGSLFFVKKTQKGYYAIQGHSRSSRTVSIESPYATSY